ncbi:hypothetical protein BH11MYX3_BH11MYX3_02600 [soil metagenome]
MPRLRGSNGKVTGRCKETGPTRGRVYVRGVGTKRPAQAPKGTTTPIDRHGLDAALRLFVTTFVVADKRTQIHTRLLTAERRAETLETLPRWIATRTAPLADADQSPSGLRARFGDLAGVRLDATGAARTTIAHALELGRGTGSVFVADSGTVALITLATGAPILCSRF